MDAPAIAEFVAQWAIANVAALIILVPLAFATGIFALDWLEALDRWLYAKEHKCSLGVDLPLREKAPEPTRDSPGFSSARVFRCRSGHGSSLTSDNK
jgi:hypothetical protein